MPSNNSLENNFLAQEIAQKHELTISDLIFLSDYLLDECNRGKAEKISLYYARRVIREGVKAMSQHKKSISFNQCVQELLKAKAHRRPRTLKEIDTFMKKLIAQHPIGEKSMHSFTTQDWKSNINRSFKTARQQHKARVLLHGLFSFAQKQGWCRDNPLYALRAPYFKEKTIRALPLNSVHKLFHISRNEEKGECFVPFLLMLYAGIRPYELEKLNWEDIDLTHKIITLSPEQAKTGGARHVTIETILVKYLKKERQLLLKRNHPLKKICPKNWQKKWQSVRKKAGWGNDPNNPWIQDCLRHTYATYHALYFKDINRLQYEMGHRSLILLKTRYINMKGITPKDANRFWNLTL